MNNNKQKLLVIGDICNRIHLYKEAISKFDEVLLVPNKATFVRTNIQELKVKVTELIDVEVDANDLRESIDTIGSVTNKLKRLQAKYGSFIWKYRANYFTINLRENVLASVALKKWIGSNRGNKIYMLVESKKYITNDYWRQFEDGSNNVLQHFVREWAVSEKIEINELKVATFFDFYSGKMKIKDYIYPKIIIIYKISQIILSKISGLFSNVEIEEFDKPIILFYSRSKIHYDSYIKIIDNYSNTHDVIFISDKYNKIYKENKLIKKYIPIGKFFKLKYLFLLSGVEKKIEIDEVEKFWDKYLIEYVSRVSRLSGFGEVFEKIMNNAIKTIKPSIIVASDEPSGQMQEIYAVAKRNGIYTLRVQHGEITEAEIVGLHGDIFADLCVVRVGGAKKLLEKYNNSKINVEEFDFYGEKQIKFAYENLAKSILICGTSLGEKNSFELIKLIYNKLTSKLVNYNFIFKPHPSESNKYFEHEFKKNSFNISVFKENHENVEVSSGVKLAIVLSSSIGVELARNKIPIFYCSFNRWLGTGYMDDAFRVFSNIDLMCDDVLHFCNSEILRSKMESANKNYLVRCTNHLNLKLNNYENSDHYRNILA